MADHYSVNLRQIGDRARRGCVSFRACPLDRRRALGEDGITEDANTACCRACLASFKQPAGVADPGGFQALASRVGGAPVWFAHCDELIARGGDGDEVAVGAEAGAEEVEETLFREGGPGVLEVRWGCADMVGWCGARVEGGVASGKERDGAVGAHVER